MAGSDMITTKADTVAVTVIIPVCNTESYLRCCLDSVRGQTLRHFECLCVDDGSTDGSRDILQEFAVADSRFRLLTNRGKTAGGARNTGLDEARGEYVICLDSDDFFEPDLLQSLYERAMANDLDLAVCCADSYLDEDGWYDVAVGVVQADLWRRMQGRAFCPREDMPQCMFQLVSASPWNKLWKTSFVREHGLRYQSLHNSNDTFFSYMGLMQARRVALVDKVLVHWRVRRHSLTRGLPQHPDCFIDALTALAAGVSAQPEAAAVRSSLMALCVDVAMWRTDALPRPVQAKVKAAIRERLEPVLQMLPYIDGEVRAGRWNKKDSSAALKFKQYAAMLAPRCTYVVALDMAHRGSWRILRHLRRMLPFFANALVIVTNLPQGKEEQLALREQQLPEHLFLHRYDAERWRSDLAEARAFAAPHLAGMRPRCRLARQESLAFSAGMLESCCALQPWQMLLLRWSAL